MHLKFNNGMTISIQQEKYTYSTSDRDWETF